MWLSVPIFRINSFFKPIFSAFFCTFFGPLCDMLPVTRSGWWWFQRAAAGSSSSIYSMCVCWHHNNDVLLLCKLAHFNFLVVADRFSSNYIVVAAATRLWLSSSIQTNQVRGRIITINFHILGVCTHSGPTFWLCPSAAIFSNLQNLETSNKF